MDRTAVPDMPVSKENQPPSPESGRTSPSYYVGVGASAGGLEALQLFFDYMRPDSGMAFIVVQHLSPDYKSLMVELLSKHTKMEVLRVENEMRIRPDCVYLIPPNKNMVIHGGKLFLSEQPNRQGLNLPIDVFFNSLAEDQGERAIGVILSGTGSDGTRGIRAVKGEGGVVIVQDEISAKFDGMPKSAIATGLADFILPPDQMPVELLKFIHHPFISGVKETAELIREEEDALTRLLGVIKKTTKVDFSYYKPNTVIRRIERRMGIAQVHTVEDYIAYTYSHPKEIKTLCKDLLIGVTKFFRDSGPFRLLRQEVLPNLIKDVQKSRAPAVRVWVAGCSTGEEAYSIAILLQDMMEASGSEAEIKVFATDIDRDAIELASVGLYPESIAADVDVKYLSRYFNKREGGYQVKRSIREMVVFAVQNVIYDPPFTKIDLISCRNLLIYLQPILQKKVLSVFNYALKPRGILFLGSSESTGELSDFFEPIDIKNRVYKHRGQGAIPLKEPLTMQNRHSPILTSPQTFYSRYETLPGGRHRELKEHYYHSLINRIVSAMMVVNEERELVQAFGDPRRYLDIPIGNVTYDILAMLPRELSLAVSSALSRARKEEKEIVYDNIRATIGSRRTMLKVKVDRLPGLKTQRELFMILLEEQSRQDGAAADQTSTTSSRLAEERIHALEQELQFTRENLQATIEELQTSNEELQATNEELLAANEELQSSNEELQSVNEELNTVNAEYQAKVVELTELNDDMNNLMLSTDIGTLFLDRDFRIRKFTPGLAREINLLEQDIGRSVTDLSLPFMEEALREAQGVLDSGAVYEHIAQNGDEWFLTRVLPFRNDDDEIDGVVITLVNITSQKQSEAAFENQYNLFKKILELSPAAQILVDKSG
ncbi:MAG: chemotaxis protein CheB, partial [Desulfobacterales bacterium]